MFLRILSVSFIVLTGLWTSACLNQATKDERPQLVQDYLSAFIDKAPNIEKSDIQAYLKKDSPAWQKLEDNDETIADVFNDIFSIVHKIEVVEVGGPFVDSSDKTSRANKFTAVLRGLPSKELRSTYDESMSEVETIEVMHFILECSRSSCEVVDIYLYNPFFGDAAVVLKVDRWDNWMSIIE